MTVLSVLALQAVPISNIGFAGADTDTAATCPGGIAKVDTFSLKGPDGSEDLWVVCEDLQVPGGAIALVSSSGRTEWFAKGYEVFGSANDDEYYFPKLGMNKTQVRVWRMDRWFSGDTMHLCEVCYPTACRFTVCVSRSAIVHFKLQLPLPCLRTRLLWR